MKRTIQLSLDKILTDGDTQPRAALDSSVVHDYAEAMKAMGYQPVPMAATDIYAGLQSGLINALPTTPIAAHSGPSSRRPDPKSGDCPSHGDRSSISQAWSMTWWAVRRMRNWSGQVRAVLPSAL